LPSKINVYNTSITVNSFYFEKENDNYPFIIQNIEDIGEEELEFSILNFDSIDDGGYIDTNKSIILYNTTYNIYFSINEYDEFGNSFLDKGNFESMGNTSRELCNLNMIMVKLEDVEEPELKKICYKTNPYQGVDLKNMTKREIDCEPNEIRMNETNIVLDNIYSFCSKQENSSQDLNTEFKPATYKDSTPYKPYPIPKKL
jgi:hypothetical protein